MPHQKRGLECFIRRINFVRRSIPDIANLLKPFTSMLKKKVVFSWSKEAKDSFRAIKEALSVAPTLVNPNFSKYFILYAYGSMGTIYTIQFQQNDQCLEKLVSFFSKGLDEV